MHMCTVVYSNPRRRITYERQQSIAQGNRGCLRPAFLIPCMCGRSFFLHSHVRTTHLLLRSFEVAAFCLDIFLLAQTLNTQQADIARSNNPSIQLFQILLLPKALTPHVSHVTSKSEGKYHGPRPTATMCQLCEIKNIAKRDRWPKNVENHKKDIDFLVTSAHDEYTVSRSKAKAKTNESVKASDPLLDFLRLLVALIEEVEADREKWWTSPQKREQRKNLELECDQKKLSELHKINNKVVEGVEAMNARLGLFVKWSLGMNGGVWELLASSKVGETGLNPVKVE